VCPTATGATGVLEIGGRYKSAEHISLILKKVKGHFRSLI